MKARCLYLTDLHKPYKESSSIKGRITATQMIQEDILRFVAENNVTHILIGGDWYDRGFHGLGPAFSAIEMDRKISAAVNGNVYLCVGNHFYLERDENPEMYIIQPNKYFKPSYNMVMPEEPIFKCVNELIIGNVQFSFFHYSKVCKNYVNDVRPGVTYHIGIYHDDYCLPQWVLEADGFRSNTPANVLNDIYRNVDLALHGHIHKRHNLVKLGLNSGREIPMFVPGSLGITSNKDILKHTEVTLPIIDISDESVVSLKTATFSTHLDKLKFYATAKKKTIAVPDAVMGHTLMPKSTSLQSLPNYLLSIGRKESALKLIDAACKGTLNLPEAVSIIMEDV